MVDDYKIGSIESVSTRCVFFLKVLNTTSLRYMLAVTKEVEPLYDPT